MAFAKRGRKAAREAAPPHTVMLYDRTGPTHHIRNIATKKTKGKRREGRLKEADRAQAARRQSQRGLSQPREREPLMAVSVGTG